MADKAWHGEGTTLDTICAHCYLRRANHRGKDGRCGPGLFRGNRSSTLAWDEHWAKGPGTHFKKGDKVDTEVTTLKNRRVCCTGRLKAYTRDQANEAITKAGGYPESRADYAQIIVLGSIGNRPSTVKLDAARRNGVPMISESTFRRLIREAQSNQVTPKSEPWVKPVSEPPPPAPIVLNDPAALIASFAKLKKGN